MHINEYTCISQPHRSHERPASNVWEPPLQASQTPQHRVWKRECVHVQWWSYKSHDQGFLRDDCWYAKVRSTVTVLSHLLTRNFPFLSATSSPFSFFRLTTAAHISCHVWLSPSLLGNHSFIYHTIHLFVLAKHSSLPSMVTFSFPLPWILSTFLSLFFILLFLVISFIF